MSTNSISAPIDPDELTVVQARDDSFLLEIERADVELVDGAIVGIVFLVYLNGGRTDGTAEIRKTLGNGIELINDSNAATLLFRLDLSRADLAALSPLVRYYWEVAVEESSGRLRAVNGLAGRLSVERSVARSAQ